MCLLLPETAVQVISHISTDFFFLPPLQYLVSAMLPSLPRPPWGQLVAPGFPHHGLRYPTKSGEDLFWLKKIIKELV